MSRHSSPNSSACRIPLQREHVEGFPARNARAIMCRCGFSFGYAHGVPPYGYRAENASLVEIAEEQAVITMMCGMRAKGSILKDIVARLNARKVATRNGNEWQFKHGRRERHPYTRLPSRDLCLIPFHAQQSLKTENPLPSDCAPGRQRFSGDVAAVKNCALRVDLPDLAGVDFREPEVAVRTGRDENRGAAARGSRELGDGP